MKLKTRFPETNVFILYRDMRAYGLREDLYRSAREKGVVFFRYDLEQGLDVDPDGKDIRVQFSDTAIRRRVEIRPDLLVLATAM